MPNSFLNISNNGILKNFYADTVRSQFNDEMPVYKNMENGSEKYSGLQVVRSLKVLRNPGIGSGSDGGILPAIGKQGTIQATISAKFNWLRFGLTAPMMKAAQGDKGSFVAAKGYEIEQGMIDLKKDVSRQLFWNGNGALATVAANAVASNSVSISGRESTEAALKFIEQGMMVDFYTAAGVAQATNVQITAVSGARNASSATITLSQSVTVSANSIIVRSGSYNNDVQGFLYSQDGGTSTIFGVDRSTYPVYQGNLVDGNGAQLSLTLLKQQMNLMLEYGGGKLTSVFSDYASSLFYEKLLVADRRFIANTKIKGDGTFSNANENYLEYAGRPWVTDPYSPQRVFMLDMSTWKKYVLSELEWATESGSDLIPQSEVDSFEARLRLWFNIFPEKPAANAVLTDYISP